ncbi:uncharacterized protein TNCV_3601381 [Trichonephila clavipes]|nr:uncharacterized protein TNCV_3601381 [Trichonephila clavipes]
MITSFINDNHETWDQFLREFAYALRAAVYETTGKTPAELFLGRKLISPIQKLVMVSDEAEFAVGNIEKLLKEARQNTSVKHEKWAKYYNKRRRDVNIRDARGGPLHHGPWDRKGIGLEDQKGRRTKEGYCHQLLPTGHCRKDLENPKRRYGKEERALTNYVPEIKSPRTTVLDLQEEQCKLKGDQYGSEENHLGGQTLTTSVDTPNNKVLNNRGKVNGTEDPVLIFRDRMNTPDSSPNNKVTNSRSRVKGTEDPTVIVHDKVNTKENIRSEPAATTKSVTKSWSRS